MLPASWLQRATNQADPEAGERYLANGILEVFERTDNADGTFMINIEFNLAAFQRLSESESDLFAAVLEDADRFCS